MKAGRFFVTGWLIFPILLSLTACGAHKNERPGTDGVIAQQNEGNALLKSVPAESDVLINKYEIDLRDPNGASTSQKVDWSRYSAEGKSDIRARLVGIINKINRIEQISMMKAAKLTGDSRPMSLNRANANHFLASLNHSEAVKQLKANSETNN